MTQAKGILPRHEDRVIKNPAATGYFIAVNLRADISRTDAQAFLKDRITPLVAELVARVPDLRAVPNRVVGFGEPGDRVSSVAVGLSPTFFLRDGAPRFEQPFQVPAGFAALPQNIPGTPIMSEIMFYVVSLSEARVASFVSGLWASRPDVTSVTIDRGYARLDGTEPFGYADGLRNVRNMDRSRVVFVHRDKSELEEPPAAEGGSYMAFMRIPQHLDAFGQLQPADQDAVIGRQRDGTRLDLVGRDVKPRDEPSESLPDGLPAGSHVRKSGPRGPHDDVQIFRRGLPFIEATHDGQVRVGLNFVSFQASLDQFDVVFGDWIMNPHFPIDGANVDHLLDPTRGLTTIERAGFFFVPPHDERHVGATLFDSPPAERRPRTGRVAIRKRVTDPSNPNARFERGGFRFHLLDQASGTLVAEIVTDSKGHAITVEIDAGKTYIVREQPTNRPNIQIAGEQIVVLDRRRVVVRFDNTVTQPGPYGAR